MTTFLEGVDQMRKPIWILAGIAVLTLFSAAIGTAAGPGISDTTNITTPDRLNEILDRGYLVVAIEPLGLPYADIIPGTKRDPKSNCSENCYSENQMTGFDVAVTGAIARNLGIESCYVTPDHMQVYQGNWSGWDLYPGYFITNDRLATYYFTKPTVSESSLFYIRTNETNITNPADISGKRIGVTVLSAQEMYLNNTLSLPGVLNENPVTNATVLEYGNEYLAVSDLLSGDLDAVLVSESTGDDYITNGSPILGLSPVAFTGYSGLAIMKKPGIDAKPLISKLDEIITHMHADGELANISTAYLGKDNTRDASAFDTGSLNQSSG